MIMAWHRSNQTSKRLHYIPGVGPMLATALLASVADPRTFRSGRNFSAWIGLVPKQHSSGGRDRLGSISKQGDRYLGSLSWPERSPLSATPRYTEPGIDPGSRRCWAAAGYGRRQRTFQQDCAHDLDKVHDWVVIYFHSDSGGEAQRTVVTATRGPLAGQRIVRGRERECLSVYERDPLGHLEGMHPGSATQGAD
jgi:hypothetical protein